MYRHFWESVSTLGDSVFDPIADMVRVTHYPEGARWPEGDDRNFGPFHAIRHDFRHTLHDGRVATWRYRFYDPYSAYGNESLPAGQPPIGRFINNVAWVPSRTVLDRMVSDLETISQECQILWWDSAIQCFPHVAQHLKRLFRLSILNFGDDMPGSSEIKTFPVALFFDVLAHAMYTWDFATGRSVPEVYAAHGLSDCRFLAWGPMERVYDEVWFARKLERLREGTLPIGMIWLGGSGIASHRQRLLRDISIAADPWLQICLYGNGMRDGWKDGRASDQYAEAMFGVNIAESSLFNGRFADLFMSGTIQVAYDPHGELSRFGFFDNEHYLCFDGTVQGMMKRIFQYYNDKKARAQMAVAAREQFLRYRAEHDDAEVQAKIVLDYERQIRRGRV